MLKQRLESTEPEAFECRSEFLARLRRAVGGWERGGMTPDRMFGGQGLGVQGGKVQIYRPRVKTPRLGRVAG